MAANLAKSCSQPVLAFDLAPNLVDAAVANGCIRANSLEDFAHVDLLVLSLPRSSNCKAVVSGLINAKGLKAGCIVLDTTSGVPAVSKELGELLMQHGIEYLDFGVAGGPGGAASAQLSGMVGGSEAALQRAMPIVALFCNANAVHYMGPFGSGHAVKAVNNIVRHIARLPAPVRSPARRVPSITAPSWFPALTARASAPPLAAQLLAANILTATEGLALLRKAGVSSEAALAAINSSSGRSLVTTERIPKHVLSGAFDFGFRLDLMMKDLRNAVDLMDGTDVGVRRPRPARGAAAPTLRRVRVVAGGAPVPPAPSMEGVTKLIEADVGADVREEGLARTWTPSHRDHLSAAPLGPGAGTISRRARACCRTARWRRRSASSPTTAALGWAFWRSPIWTAATTTPAWPRRATRSRR